MKCSKKTALQIRTGRPKEPGSIRVTLDRVKSWPGWGAATFKQIREWKAKGYDFSSPTALSAGIQSQQRIPKNVPVKESALRKKLKIRKLLAECERVEHQLAELRGSYTRNDLLASQCRRIQARTRAELLRLKADAPTWEGMKAEEIENRVSDLIDTICKKLRNPKSYR